MLCQSQVGGKGNWPLVLKVSLNQHFRLKITISVTFCQILRKFMLQSTTQLQEPVGRGCGGWVGVYVTALSCFHRKILNILHKGLERKRRRWLAANRERVC